MANNELIQCFLDSVNISNSILKAETQNAILSNRVYKENFISQNRIIRNKNHFDVFDYIIFEATTSFNAAKQYLQYGKTAVLNFANPHNPGGGVNNGATAQEECLCRSSNLYPCISDKNVYNEYYLYNKKIPNNFFSDRLIYTKDVTVFKDDSNVPHLMPKTDWFKVDVITCAAPYIAKRKYTNRTALKELFKGRIKNIFEAAIDNGVEVIILGAFGCGAFKNPPEVVAKAFHEVIKENDYACFFKKIVFAIKSNYSNNYNYETFYQEFFADYMQTVLKMPELPLIEPLRSICDDFKILSDYENWKTKNKYYGKQFSILGDSISTLAGYNPKGYNVFYYGESSERANVKEMENTWWGKVIDFFGGELLVNNSCSGSRVTRLPDNEVLFPSGCSNERTGSLHINNIKPDVIIIYLGTNDWAFGANTSYVDNILGNDFHCDSFDFAYSQMLSKIRSNYPNAEVWCCTLNTTFMSSNPSFEFPYAPAETHIEKYNQIIKDTANMHKCKVIDLYNYNTHYDSIDGTHPNADGMNTLATLMIKEMGDSKAIQFMNLENKNNNTEKIYDADAANNKKYSEEQLLKILEEALEKYHANTNDTDALKVIALTMAEVPLYFPMDFDVNKMLAGVDPLQLKKGDTVTTQEDVKMNILTLQVGDEEIVPMFTSAEQAHKGPDVNIVRLYPQNYLPLVISMNKDFAVNPFGEHAISLKCGFLSDIVLPLVQDSLKSNEDKSDKRSNESNTYIDEDIPRVINGRYELLRLIGEGAMTKVYLATDKAVSKVRAVKITKTNALNNSDFVREAVLKEAETVKLFNHPAIPKVIDIIVDSQYVAIVQDYVEGETLKDIVEKYAPQPVERVVDWAKQVCDILSYLHSFNPPYIHRDIKPANLMLEPNGTIKLIDFGIMRTYNPNKTQDTCFLGTRGYAAPEQFGGCGQTDARTDIFCLGMTMYHLLTGLDPKSEAFFIAPLCQVNPQLPKGLEYVVNKCTQLDPVNRYQSCAELKNDLNNYQNLPPKQSLFSKLFNK